MSGKVYICTGTMGDEGSAWRRLYDLTLETKIKYVEKWGGHVRTDMLGEERWNQLCCNPDGTRKWQHTGFARTRACQNEVEFFLRHPEWGVEQVLWSDADAVFTRFDVDLCEYLNYVSPTAAFYCSLDGNGINSGVMAFRVCPESLDLLERVWNDDPSRNTGRWWEQGSLSDIATEMGVMAHPPKYMFDAYPQGWQWADFIPGESIILHAPAKSDEERYEAISQALAAVGYKPAP